MRLSIQKSAVENRDERQSNKRAYAQLRKRLSEQMNREILSKFPSRMNDCEDYEKTDDNYCRGDRELWRPKGKVDVRITGVNSDGEVSDVFFCISKPVALESGEDGFCARPKGCRFEELYAVRYLRLAKGQWVPLKEMWSDMGYNTPKAFVAGPIDEHYSEEGGCNFVVEENAEDVDDAIQLESSVLILDTAEALTKLETVPAGLPNMFYPAISSEEGYEGQQRWDCRTIDIDGDGVEELLVFGTDAGGFCGPHSCEAWMFKTVGNGWKELLSGSGANIKFTATQTRGFPDLVAVIAQGAYGDYGPDCDAVIHYAWNGDRYVELETCSLAKCPEGEFWDTIPVCNPSKW